MFSFQYGMKVMKGVGMDIKTIRAGNANMFMSDVFCETLAGVSGATIELYETDGSQGAARGAGVGAGIYGSVETALRSLEKRKVIEPRAGAYAEAYAKWESHLESALRCH